MRTLYRHWKRFDPRDVGTSQSNEADLLDRLLDDVESPKTFCEFGFDVAEFNCGRLALRGWHGLLIDGSEGHVRTARAVFRRAKHLNVSAVSAFLDVTNVHAIIAGHFGHRALGVLSVDVDGNDYWLLDVLMPLRPTIIIVEYNASFGLRPITVPYDPAFERHRKHPTGWYHGASITALYALCAQQGYSLVAVSESGSNLFFVKDDRLPSHVPRLEPAQAYRESRLRNQWSGTTAEEQWAAVCDLPMVSV